MVGFSFDGLSGNRLLENNSNAIQSFTVDSFPRGFYDDNRTTVVP